MIRGKTVPKQISEKTIQTEIKGKLLKIGIYTDEKNKKIMIDFRTYIERKEFCSYTHNGVRLYVEFLDEIKKAITELEPVIKSEQERMAKI